MIIFIPIVQLLILVPAVTFDIKNIKICVVDQDLSTDSQNLIAKFQGSDFFKVKYTEFSLQEAENLMHNDKVDVILNIPSGFSEKLIKSKNTGIQLLINAVNASFAQSAYAYCNGIIMSFNKNIISENISVLPIKPTPVFSVNSRYWYNAELKYPIYMAPGILVILVTAIGFMVSGLNLVREKEIGTSEQINVTPIKKYQLIAGKLIPFLILALVDFTIGLGIAVWVYKMPVEGSLFLLYGFATIYLIAVLGMGLFLSTLADTQQQYLFLVFFFIMIFVLMSGIFTPVESMPIWAQKFNIFNPVSYFMKVIRMILLKGSGLRDVLHELYALSILGTSMLIMAVWRYRKKA